MSSLAHPSVSYSRCKWKTAVSAAAGPRKTAVGPSQLHIRIDSLATEENKFSVKLPLDLYQVGLAIARSYSARLARLSVADLQTKIEKACRNVVLDESDQAHDERIQILLENGEQVGNRFHSKAGV